MTLSLSVMSKSAAGKRKPAKESQENNIINPKKIILDEEVKSLIQSLGIDKNAVSKKLAAACENKIKNGIKEDFANLVKTLRSEREYYVNGQSKSDPSFIYLRTWQTRRALWEERYPTEAWRLSHQKILLSICLNEFKMKRDDFKILLQHLKEEGGKEINEVLQKLLKGAEDCRKLWEEARVKYPGEQDDLTVALLTCVRPVSTETVMRMRKIKEMVDPDWLVSLATKQSATPKKHPLAKKIKRLVRKSLKN